MSKRFVTVTQRQSGEALISAARWCSSPWCRFVGFQGRRRLKPGEALILVHKKDSISASSIHMFFVFTALTVVWINQEGRVTHVVLARPWRPYYASPTPACYVLETSPALVERFVVGDQIDFTPKE